jgi:hypothetical protein
MLMVGSELIKAEPYTDQWRRVIDEVRRNYRGKLGYSANWDHYQPEKIKFWDALDYVGMTSYYELAAGPNPGIEEIDANWAAIKTDIKAFQEQVKKPIIFTEVGWCSQEGAAHEGWNYYANQKATDAGRQEQALLYKSFMQAWSGEPGVGGVICGNGIPPKAATTTTTILRAASPPRPCSASGLQENSTFRLPISKKETVRAGVDPEMCGLRPQRKAAGASAGLDGSRTPTNGENRGIAI